MNSRFPDLPRHMAHLPVDHRNIPVPWFVAWVDGKPFFPAIDAAKITRAWNKNLCWVCGGLLGRWRASVIGPMCAINRVISEPQSHLECARFSARNCPFLANPRMKRVPEELFNGGRGQIPGEHLDRNPGACCVWIEQKRARPFNVGNGVLFELGDPDEVEWYANGRLATRQEVEQAIQSGLSALVDSIEREAPHNRPAAREELERRLTALLRMVEELPA